MPSVAEIRPVVIAGPTASGKSALALALAERDGGWILNADALQVYDCWRVLTARPDDDACARAPHRLYGHVAGDADYSVGHWLREIRVTINEARAAGTRPILVGGTGLYLGALTTGLHPIPPIPREVRARSEAALRAGRIAALIDDLARNDAATLAQLDRNNPMRVQRAWEVLTATGRGLSEWRKVKAEPILPEWDSILLKITPETHILNNNINNRFKTMVEDGALDEAARFRALGLDVGRPAGRALGAAELIAHLNGDLTVTEAIEAAVAATRRYAKRQRTWLRNRMAGWNIVDLDADPLAQIPRD